MKAEELNLINSMLAVIKDKITNAEIQKYIENHLCELLDKNNIMNDLTTGIEIYDEENGMINEYFKLIFYPEKRDFNYKNFIKLETVYSFGNLKSEKKTIKLIGDLVEVVELDYNHDEKYNFNTIQTVRKKEILK